LCGCQNTDLSGVKLVSDRDEIQPLNSHQEAESATLTVSRNAVSGSTHCIHFNNNNNNNNNTAIYKAP